MNINELNELPDWRDDHNEEETGQLNETKEICKKLYQKWNEILMMINGATADSENNDTSEEVFLKHSNKAAMLADAYEIGAKLRSSEARSMFINKMENAAIIRKNAQFVKSSMLTLVMEGEIAEEYGELIRTEIDVFRELFIWWVKSFKKDDNSDEWGLFN